MRFVRVICLGFLLPLCLTGCQTLRALEKQVTYVTLSPPQEAELGNQYHQELSKDLAYITDPTVQSWIDGVGERLIAHSPDCAQTFKFRVTTAEQVNAFAIPGGYCYINGGLIEAAENEAQVVAVVAHEINHVTTRHGVRSLQRVMGLDLLADTLAPEGGSGAAAAQLVKQAGGLVAMRSFSREDEREADRLGVEAMYEAGWDPREAAEFFKTLYNMEGRKQPAKGGVSSFLNQVVSTHPATRERIENIQQQIQTYDLGPGLQVNSEEFEQVKQIVVDRIQKSPPAE